MRGWHSLLPILLITYVMLLVVALTDKESKDYPAQKEVVEQRIVKNMVCEEVDFPKMGRWMVADVCVYDGVEIVRGAFPETDVSYKRYIQPVIDSLKTEELKLKKGW